MNRGLKKICDDCKNCSNYFICRAPKNKRCVAYEKSKTLHIKIGCRICTKKQVIDITTTRYQLWRGGFYIQDAMNNLSKDDREMFISQICKECFDKMFIEDEDEDNNNNNIEGETK